MPRTMNESLSNLRGLAAQARAAAEAVANAASNSAVPMDEVNRLQNDLRNATERHNAAQAAHDAMFADTQQRLEPVPENAHNERTLRDILSSREYARSFAYAMRNGLNPRNARGNEMCKPLYDAMTIGGGDPAGEDGGFLVPEDVDNQIKEIRRTLNPLSELFTSENVSTNSGWRVMDSAPTLGMSAVDEMGTISPTEQPTFAKVPFQLSKYALLIPVSNELASDEVANLFGYLARWFAKKAVITENALLIDKLDDLSASAISAGDELTGIKTALNVTLDPMIAANATILTNQSGFNVLDTLVDGVGRPLLSPDPVTGSPKLFKTRPIIVVSNAVLPNESGGAVAPIYIGDFTQYATLFSRNPLEIRSTDIGGNAFRTDSIEVRGVKRMGVSKFDTASVVRRTLVI